MTRVETLIREAKDVPDVLLDEALDFLRYLKLKYQEVRHTERFEALLLSESALAKDWLRPEEDKAWQDL